MDNAAMSAQSNGIKRESPHGSGLAPSIDRDVKPSMANPASSWLLPEDDDDQNDKESTSSALLDAERDQKRSGSSREASQEQDEGPVSRTRRKRAALPDGPTQSAAHLPRADGDALKTFTEIKSNIYQNSKIGRSRGYKNEAMECECRRQRGDDPDMLLCGEFSECINRLTQVECKGSDCSCGPECANQRFQRREYADVEVVQTEKKGFGLRAARDIRADHFVYEYIGEVVQQDEFMKRMKQYRDEQIRHFYFMMLQREEFLDATRKGGIARFINHSCNPNCYVSKWHVGKHMRMGIFAKRDIARGEELTFNYNVDRYGNDAQPCYCGEPNCVGSIGGKTQTDIGGMDQLFIDALGIADEVDRIDAKGTRKKKSMLLDEDFKPQLRPLDENDDVAKIMTAVRQAASNRSVLQKLLSRIHMTQDSLVQRSLVRLHGFLLLSSILDEWRDDKEIVLLSMGSLARWPLLARNKVVDSGIDKQVQELTESSDDEISSLAKDLLSAWDALEMSYRIARREARDSNGPSFLSEQRRIDDPADDMTQQPLDVAQAPNAVSSRLESVAPRPLGTAQLSNGTPSRSNGDIPRRKQPVPLPNTTHAKQPALSIEEIIKRANDAETEKRRQAEEAAIQARSEAIAAEERASKKRDAFLSGASKKRSGRPDGSTSSEKRRRPDDRKSSSSRNGSIEDAERRLKKLVGEVVVRCMSIHKAELERDVFKKHAKDLTNIICDKEKKNPKMWPPRDLKSKYLADGLSRDKKEKVQSFAKDYITKLIAHRRAKKPHTSERTSNGHGPSTDTPASGASQTSATPQYVPREDDDDVLASDGDEDDDAGSSHDGRKVHSLTSVPASPASNVAARASEDGAQ